MFLSVSDEDHVMKIGAELTSTCRNCGEHPHTVTTRRDSSTATVTCNKCGAEQLYLAADGAAIAPLISVNASGTVRGAPKRGKKAAAVWGPDHSAVRAVLSRPIRSYSLGDVYRVGDRIEHRTFGLGVVDEILGPQKMKVFFPTGHRVMAQQRPATA